MRTLLLVCKASSKLSLDNPQQSLVEYISRVYISMYKRILVMAFITMQGTFMRHVLITNLAAIQKQGRTMQVLIIVTK